MKGYRPFSKEYLKLYITLSAMLLLGATWIALNGSGIITSTVCPSRLIWDLPCPGCGMTRSINALMAGDLSGAIHFNPNVLIIAPAIVIALALLVYDLAANRTISYRAWEAVNRLLAKKWAIGIVILFEIIVEIHHFKAHI